MFYLGLPLVPGSLWRLVPSENRDCRAIRKNLDAGGMGTQIARLVTFEYSFTAQGGPAEVGQDQLGND